MGKNKKKPQFTKNTFKAGLLKKGKKRGMVELGRELARKDKTKKIKNERWDRLTAGRKAIKEKKLRKAARVLYNADDHVLLLGEGNFSFTHALVQIFKNKAAKKKAKGTLCGTCFDDEKSLNTKYPDAADTIAKLTKSGVRVLTAVDATDLSKHKKLTKLRQTLFKEADKESPTGSPSGFDKIVFNFPHTGCGEKDTDKNNQIHREFLKSFFESALPLLRKEDESTPIRLRPEIHVTLKLGQPYDSWFVAQVGAEANLQLKTSERFYADLYPGYEHRRTIGTFEKNRSGKNTAVEEADEEEDKKDDEMDEDEGEGEGEDEDEDEDEGDEKDIGSTSKTSISPNASVTNEFLKSGARTYIFVPKY